MGTTANLGPSPLARLARHEPQVTRIASMRSLCLRSKRTGEASGNRRWGGGQEAATWFGGIGVNCQLILLPIFLACDVAKSARVVRVDVDGREKETINDDAPPPSRSGYQAFSSGPASPDSAFARASMQMLCRQPCLPAHPVKLGPDREGQLASDEVPRSRYGMRLSDDDGRRAARRQPCVRSRCDGPPGAAK